MKLRNRNKISQRGVRIYLSTETPPLMVTTRGGIAKTVISFPYLFIRPVEDALGNSIAAKLVLELKRVARNRPQ